MPDIINIVNRKIEKIGLFSIFSEIASRYGQNAIDNNPYYYRVKGADKGISSFRMEKKSGLFTGSRGFYQSGNLLHLYAEYAHIHEHDSKELFKRVLESLELDDVQEHKIPKQIIYNNPITSVPDYRIKLWNNILNMYKNSKNNESQVKQYMVSRGIENTTYVPSELKAINLKLDFMPKPEKTIMMPIHDGDDIIGMRVRFLEGDNKTKIYNKTGISYVRRCHKTKSYYICEGLETALTIANTVELGTVIATNSYNGFKDLKRIIPNDAYVTLVPDTDNPFTYKKKDTDINGAYDNYYELINDVPVPNLPEFYNDIETILKQNKLLNSRSIEQHYKVIKELTSQLQPLGIGAVRVIDLSKYRKMNDKKGYDLNDLLNFHGQAEVKKVLTGSTALDNTLENRQLAVQQIDKAIYDGMRKEGATTFIYGSQGIGKSKQMIDNLIAMYDSKRYRDKKILVTFPTQEKANEAYDEFVNRASFLERYMDNPDGVVHYMGRSYQNHEKQLCENLDYFKELGSYGIPEFKRCKACPLKSQCEYIKQMIKIKEGASVVFTVHNVVFNATMPSFRPDIIFIDESPFNSALSYREIDLNDSKNDFRFLDADQETQDTLSAWRHSIIYKRNFNNIEDLRKAFKNLKTEPKIEDDEDGAEIDIAQLKDLYSQYNYSLAKYLKGAIKNYLLSHDDKSQKFEIRLGRRGEVVYRYYRPYKLKADDNASVIHLDGTGNKEFIKLWLPEVRHPKINDVKVELERNAKIIQVGIEGSKKSLMSPTYLYSVLSKIENIDAIIAQKGVTEKIKQSGLIDEYCETGHFNAIRGINAFEKCESLAILGRILPPIQDIELMAKSLSNQDIQSQETWNDIEKSISTKSGENHIITYKEHSNKIVNIILNQLREAEVEQAIDRARLIHNEKPKTIYIFNNLVGNWKVDHYIRGLVELKEYRGFEAFKYRATGSISLTTLGIGKKAMKPLGIHPDAPNAKIKEKANNAKRAGKFKVLFDAIDVIDKLSKLYELGDSKNTYNYYIGNNTPPSNKVPELEILYHFLEAKQNMYIFLASDTKDSTNRFGIIAYGHNEKEAMKNLEAEKAIYADLHVHGILYMVEGYKKAAVTVNFNEYKPLYDADKVWNMHNSKNINTADNTKYTEKIPIYA